MRPQPINFDHHAHTPLDPEVRTILHRAIDTLDVNIHAATAAAERARAEVDRARGEVAVLLGVAPGEIVFTSGATEANALAVIGASYPAAKLGRRRVVVGAGEHPSVLAAADQLSDFDVVRAPLTPSGRIDLDALQHLITTDTALVSVAAANHEVGVVQPIAAIGILAHAAGALFHTDLAQAVGWIEADLSHADLASLSAHKINGPLGIGALMVRRGARSRIGAHIPGGGQEGGLRGGTLAAPLCAAFGAAAALVRARRADDSVHVARIRDRLLEGLSSRARLVVHGGMDERLPNNLNLRFEGVDGEALVMHVRDQLSIATGSACTAQSLEPSHVLIAMGLDQHEAEGAIRVGLGRGTTEADIDEAVRILVAAVDDLSRIRRRRHA